jgi:hypothetical protein
MCWFVFSRTWTATDSCGNSSTASQTINVQDKTAPVIAAPAIQLSIVLLLQYLPAAVALAR